MSSTSLSNVTRVSRRNEKSGITGLQNIGNTCFLNSVIQCLSNTTPLLEYILNEEYINDIKKTSKGFLVKQFADLIQALWGEQRTRSSLSTHALKHAVVLYAPRFHGSSQQDAQEFLRCLLEGLHTETNQARDTRPSISNQPKFEMTHNNALSAEETWQKYLQTDNSKIVHIFGGLLRSVLSCTICDFTSVIFEPFWDLSLPILADNFQVPQRKLNLNLCLDFFTMEERLEGNEKPTCSKCKTKQICTKKMSIEKFPQVLVIHLKRFSDGDMARKVDTLIDYPIHSLDMTEYSAKAPRRSVLYNLYGVVNHYGSCQFGHYTACCRHPYTGVWHHFNDRTVTPINSDQINKEHTYILFYEIESKQLRNVVGPM